MNKKRVLLFCSPFILWLLVLSVITLTNESFNSDNKVIQLSIYLFAILLYALSAFECLYLFYNIRKDKATLSFNKKEMASRFIDMSEERRNALAWDILSKLEEALPSATLEDGSAAIEIKSGKDARRIKRTVEYVVKRIQPTDPELLDALESKVDYHNHMMTRYFDGSTMVHILAWIVPPVGLLYHYCAKRPVYLLQHDDEKDSSFWSSIISDTWGTKTTSNTKYTNYYTDGSKERDYGREVSETVFTGILGFILKIVMSLFWMTLGVALAPISSFIKFFKNYGGNLLSPFKDQDKWFAEEYLAQSNNIN